MTGVFPSVVTFIVIAIPGSPAEYPNFIVSVSSITFLSLRMENCTAASDFVLKFYLLEYLSATFGQEFGLLEFELALCS